MNSLQLTNATRRMAAPPNWDHARDGICHTLEICDRDGWMISAWLPTQAELGRLKTGTPVFLHIQGRSHPVVSLTVGEEAAALPPLPQKAEIHNLVFAAVMRALEVGAPGLVEGGHQPIALNAAVRASTQIDELLRMGKVS